MEEVQGQNETAEERRPPAGDAGAESPDEISPVDPAPSSQDAGDGGSRWPKRLRLTAIVVGVTLLLWLVFTWVTWPDVESLRDRDPETTAFIEMYRASERSAGRTGDVAWQPVPYDRISANLKRSAVASEDTEFFFHDGFSSHEMKEALKRAIREREAPRGASTITQQVAKNLWLTPSRSLTRKLREAMLTRQLEKHLSKARILDLYLNLAEFGPGIYGAEAAARHYFARPASDLTPRQAAMLVAGLPRPKTWNPASDSEYYRASVERILAVQDQLDYLDRYVGPGEPGSIDVRAPEVPAPAP
jgi:monofunctional biosynthetic peptidoglycan transglycosylase